MVVKTIVVNSLKSTRVCSIYNAHVKVVSIGPIAVTSAKHTETEQTARVPHSTREGANHDFADPTQLQPLEGDKQQPSVSMRTFFQGTGRYDATMTKIP